PPDADQEHEVDSHTSQGTVAPIAEVTLEHQPHVLRVGPGDGEDLRLERREAPASPIPPYQRGYPRARCPRDATSFPSRSKSCSPSCGSFRASPHGEA